MILIVDFGSQTAHLIARRVRDLGVKVEITPPEDALTLIQKLQPKGIILSGGPASVYGHGAPSIDKQIFTFGIPVLGICYGQQLITHVLGGTVKPGKTKEFGPAMLRVSKISPLFTGLSDKPFEVWMSHGDKVEVVPSGFQVIATTWDVIAAMHDLRRRIYCVQFHPEVKHTRYGQLIMRNFAEGICGLPIKKRSINLDEIIAQTKKAIGKSKVICAVSGGVDSTVAAAIVAKAASNQLIPVFVESGLMRPGTREMVELLFKEHFGISAVTISAEKKFLGILKGVTDPEIKRRRIGKLYIDLFKQEATKHTGLEILVQGTIFSDVIESKGNKHAAKIKSHHNVGGLPDILGFKLVEPLREFYKDEVRKIGKLLKLPEETIQRQVFPGPGYAIRIVGEVTPSRLATIKQADTIVLEELQKANWLNRVYMSFPIMTNVMSTAVKGDGRFCGEVIALRIIESSDVMTSNWVRLPSRLLQKLSSRIVNEVPGISRVVYDITTKPPATMEWE